MTYSLVLKEHQDGGVTKDIAENVFLHGLSDEYKVFAFYYPSAIRNEPLEDALRGLGDLTGRNLLVNIGKLNDPAFGRVVKAFEIKKYPVVVVTATKDLAGPPDENVNVYVRIDNDRLLADPPRATQVIQEIFGLFLRGEIADAISKAKWKQRSELARAVGNRVTAGLRHLAHFVAERDFKVSVLGGSFELTKSRG